MSDYSSLEGRREFLNRCTRCNQCKFVPVAKSQQHANVCPSVDYGEFHSYSGGGQVVMGAGLVTGHVDYTEGLISSISACTMCGACDVACKISHGETVEPLDSLYALRAQIVKDKQSPPAHQKMQEALKLHGNTAGLPRADRARWLESLATKPGQDKNADVLFHIGANLSYDDSKHDALRSIVKRIQDSGTSIAYLGADEDSSGSTAFDLGYQDDAKKFAQKFSDQIAQLQVATVVTFSSAAIAAYRGIYLRLGVLLKGVRVLHITEYVCELMEKGIVAVEASSSLSGQDVAYHDSCKLGRLSERWEPRDLGLDVTHGAYYVSRDPNNLRFGNEGIYEAPRALLQAMGVNLVELERDRASSYCCGASGGVREAIPEAANKAARTRLAEVETSSSNTLVSGCGNCAGHLSENSSKPIEVLDLINLLGECIKTSPKSAKEGA